MLTHITNIKELNNFVALAGIKSTDSIIKTLAERRLIVSASIARLLVNKSNNTLLG